MMPHGSDPATDRTGLYGSRVHSDYPLAYGLQDGWGDHDSGVTVPADPETGVTTSDDDGKW